MSVDEESPAPRSSAEVPWDEVPCIEGRPSSKLRASLKGLATLCRTNAAAHGKAAKKHNQRNHLFQIASIAVTSGATICAAVSLADTTWAGQLVVAILTATSSATQAVIGLFNPEGRREKHLATEHRYTCLARDIVVKLVSGTDNVEYWEDVLRDSQRILDNIEAVAPDL